MRVLTAAFSLWYKRWESHRKCGASMEHEPLTRAGPFHPARPLYRFVILIFVSSLSFGSYFAYDIVGAISPTLIEELGAARGTLGAFYTMYSIAAILTVLVGGILIDRLGTRKASLLFSLLVLAGAALVWVAKSTFVFFLGRFIFGAGSEPLIVAQSSILARWFKNKELALSFGIALTVSRLGTLFAFNTGELIASVFGSFRYALFSAVLFCMISLGANVVYILMDRRGERILNLRDGSQEKFVFRDIKAFKASYWYVVMLCVTFYSAIFPFTALSTDFFVDKWGIARVAESEGGFFSSVFNNFLHMFSTAGGITSIIIFASMLLAPFAGRLVDRVGKRATLMILGSLIMIPSHLAMGLTRIYPAYPMAALGAAFVLVPAAMWPSVPLIVRKERVGTAFGLMTAIQNIGLGLFPLLNGLLRDITKTYTSSLIMFASLGFFGLVFALLLKRADTREGGALERGTPRSSG
ncbi:MAG: MFS transporter [Candidatus Aminicenantales bacterium]